MNEAAASSPSGPSECSRDRSLRGADVAGRDAVDADAAPRELDGKAAHQADDTSLGGGIVDMLVPAIGDAHDRGEGDDRAGAALDHRRHGGADDPEDALQVDLEGVVPLLVGERRERHLVGDAGIGDDHVDGAEPRLDVGDDRVGARRVGDVEAAGTRRCRQPP